MTFLSLLLERHALLRLGRQQQGILELHCLSFVRFQSQGKRVGGGGRAGRNQSASERRKGNNNKSQVTNPANIQTKVVEPDPGTIPPSSGWKQWFTPVRFRSSGSTYTREQLVSLSQRLPLWIAVVAFFVWDETSPYTFLRIRGPSMIPTILPDGSEVWLRSTWVWWRRMGFLLGPPPYRRGDLVGFCHPDHPTHISCKRIVGVAGDTVKRYGEYVHLYVDQDPNSWGIIWPQDEEQVHAWIDRKSSWAQDYCLLGRKEESQRTIVVPEGHVWVEGDCPALSIDSRHFGPIPVEWLKGKVVRRLWPLWENRVAGRSKRSLQHQSRPHPIPMDEDNLRRFNLHFLL